VHRLPAFAVACLALAAAASTPAQTPPPAPGEEVVADVAPGDAVRPAEPAPARRSGEGAGPFARLVVRGVTLIDGTGAPPVGPVDLVIEGGRIAEIHSVGYPGVAIRDARGAPIGSIGIAAIRSRMGPERIRSLLPMLLEEREQIERQLAR